MGRLILAAALASLPAVPPLAASPLDRIRIDRTHIVGSIDPVNPVYICKVEQIHAADGIADGDSHQPRTVLAASAAADRQRCLDLVQVVIEDLSENQSLLARLRDRLAKAAALCREGRTQEAETLLRELQGQWMPMGPGN